MWTMMMMLCKNGHLPATSNGAPKTVVSASLNNETSKELFILYR
jgi:hypothetical protein